MNDAKEKSAERLNALNTKLQGVENYLLHRALDRSRGELEQATDFINQAAENGVIEIEFVGDEPHGNEAEADDGAAGGANDDSGGGAGGEEGAESE